MHVVELFQYFVDVLDACPAAGGDALAPGAVDDVRPAAFVGGHRLDDRLDFHEGFLVGGRARSQPAHSRDHAHDLPEGAHFPDFPQLFKEILEGELGFPEFFLEFPGLLLVESFPGLLDQGDDVAHAEDPPGHPLGMENLQGVEFLTHSDEFDGLVDNGPYREGRTAPCVAVELREDDAVEIEPVVKGLRRVHRVLPGHGVDDKEDFVGVHLTLDRLEFFHHLLVDVESSGRVDDDDVAGRLPGVVDRLDGDVDRAPSPGRVDGHADLRTEHFELVDGGRAVHVGGHEDRRAAFRFEMRRQLRRKRGLPRALQSGDHDHGRGHRRVLQRGRGRSHQRNEFVVDNFNNELAGREAREHFLPHRLQPDALDKILDDPVIDVGVEKHPPHFPQRFGDVPLRDLPLPAKFLEDEFEFLSQIFEHERTGGVVFPWLPRKKRHPRTVFRGLALMKKVD